MKFSRRNIFGLAAGAAVAGPKLAAEIASNTGSFMPAPSHYGGYATAGQVVGGGDWKLERITHLKSILSGKDPSATRNRTMQRLYMAETVERHRLDSLRSVASQHKVVMLIEGEPDRQERTRRADAEFELADLLEVKLPF